MDRKKQLKVGVWIGDGPSPGYVWDVAVLDFSHREGLKSLNEDQFDHLRDQVRDLAMEGEPTQSPKSDVRAIEDF